MQSFEEMNTFLIVEGVRIQHQITYYIHTIRNSNNPYLSMGKLLF